MLRRWIFALAAPLLASTACKKVEPPPKAKAVPVPRPTAAAPAALSPGPEDPRRSLAPLRHAPGKTVRVNGAAADSAEIDRALVYQLGKGLLDRKIVTFLCEEELQSRISAGTDPASFKVLGEEVEKKIAQARAQFQAENPSVDFEKNLRAMGMTPESLREEVATALVFDRLFLPDDPEQWPEVSKQILQAKGAGALLDNLDKNKAPDGKPQPLPEVLKMSFRQWLLQDLMKAARIKYASDGLPPETVLTVNDRPLRTKEALEKIAPQVTPEDREQALRWTAIVTAVRQALVAEGAYLTEEETLRRWEAAREPYDKSIFPFEAVIITLKRFPTMEVYRTFFRLIESYRKKIAAEINDESLKRHIPSAQDFLGGGSVQASVLLCSAWDFPTNSSLGPAAWEEARRKADEVRKRLVGGADFDQLLAETSGYPEKVPNPNASAKQQYNRGKFLPLSKNELKGMLGESEFDSFLRGYSIADLVFEPDRTGILGPIQGPFGYYIVKIEKRNPGTRTLAVDNPNQRQLLEEDYLSTRFLAWSNEVVAKARIEVE